MKLLISAIGRMRKGPERTLYDDYAGRIDPLARPLGFRGLRLVEGEDQRPGPDRKDREAELLLKPVTPGAALIAMDERGTALDSQNLAKRLGAWRDNGCPEAAFLIGGADGLAPELRARADLVLSFGPATWPHMLARVMLIEQLYRSATILAGHPYHRA